MAFPATLWILPHDMGISLFRAAPTFSGVLPEFNMEYVPEAFATMLLYVQHCVPARLQFYWRSLMINLPPPHQENIYGRLKILSEEVEIYSCLCSIQEGKEEKKVSLSKGRTLIRDGRIKRSNVTQPE